MKVRLTYGRDSITKELPAGSTVADLATSSNISFLGAPADNYSLSRDVDYVDPGDLLEDGDEIVVEQKLHKKA